MQEDNVEIDPINDTEVETVETPAIETPEETIDTPEVDVEKLQATNKKLYERAKKAEAELKAIKPKAPPAPSQVSPQLNVEETVLLANGMSEELLAELKAVAAVRQTSLIKAQNDPIFVAVKEKFERDLKHKNASLPASRGSGSVKPQKTFTTPGLTREEHKKMVLSNL
jgi:hypothetical protein